MANEGYHEPIEELTDATRDMHRAIISLMEELEAVDWYNQRVDACRDKELRAILARVLTPARVAGLLQRLQALLPARLPADDARAGPRPGPRLHQLPVILSTRSFAPLRQESAGVPLCSRA